MVKTASNTLRHAVGNCLTGAGLLAALLAMPALADELADVSKLLRAGKASEALARTNAYLARNPADPQMRFMKGVLLTEQNKSDEAIAICFRSRARCRQCRARRSSEPREWLGPSLGHAGCERLFGLL